ncbi:ricin B-like lectin, partial [Fomitiporia mediterranea MF3/22]|uniref:ricin B-like lectin n=1 Tax=Fomitiporia mediterranea (strain MF3/22) TaxID=694068 RepID=UPI00044098AF
GIAPGTYKIVNAKGGTALDLSGGDNRTIIGFTVHGQANQQWTVSEPDSDDNQTIFCQASNLYLAIEDAPNDYTRIIASSSPTRWAIRRDGKDQNFWRVFFPGTGFNFDLSDHGNPTPGTVIHLWSATDGRNQLWNFENV